jgi:hypothetical protein
MTYAKVSSRIRYAAFLSPITRQWHVRREVLSPVGVWQTKPSVLWNCIDKHSAGQLADKQAALEKHLARA